MDLFTTPKSDMTLGQEVVGGVIVAVAATAATIAAYATAGFVIGKIVQIKEKRTAKFNTITD